MKHQVIVDDMEREAAPMSFSRMGDKYRLIL